MKHVGSTILLLISLGLFIVLLPHLQYINDASAFNKKPLIKRPIISTHFPLPTVIPTFTIQTSSSHFAITPTPTPTIILLPTPTPLSSFGLDSIQSSLLGQINDYRKFQGLGPVSPNKVTCDFATMRAQEITTNFSHQGFDERVSSKTLPYSSYSLVVENIAMNSDMGQVVSNWISSPGHSANMRADTPYGCVGHNGAYYAYEAWRP